MPSTVRVGSRDAPRYFVNELLPLPCAGHPDADLSHLTAPDAFAENVEELAEAGLDIVRNLVFGDLTGQAIFLCVIVDDFLKWSGRWAAGAKIPVESFRSS
ncbi:MAG: hypothetical protein MZV70_52370 [Desulfobacterales bacterium]|nr:hypothetical protein [Desulfobacterales bacterium]